MINSGVNPTAPTRVVVTPMRGYLTGTLALTLIYPERGIQVWRGVIMMRGVLGG